MSKKKYIPPDGEDGRRRRFRWLLRQKPKERILVAVVGIPALLAVLCIAPAWATALLLAALTLIFNDTVIPRITQEIEGLFGAAN